VRKELRRWLRRLHDELLAPLRQWLPARDGLITIVPHGALFRLSFAALTDRRGRYLIEDYQIAYAPSVAVLRLLHARGGREGPRSYLLVGNPTLPATLARSRGFASLPGAVREVEAIRRDVAPAATTVLRRTEASESSVRRVVADASVVHLATHAVTDDADPLESFLALAADGEAPDRDGRLTAEDIYDLWLDADLVVLSACRSATGPVTGDGLLGLTRAFFASGTRSVVATLWDLPDEAARVARLAVLARWETPGPGSFYDDLGHVGRSPHVRKARISGANPPELEDGPTPHFTWEDEGRSRKRLSWQVSLRWPIALVYEQIDPTANYLVRLNGNGDVRLRINGIPVTARRASTTLGDPKEFVVPADAVRSRRIVLSFDDIDESDRNWRQHSRVHEAWLVKLPSGTAP